ncbi:NEW3 domain-containing protein [Truepera radiovictrix]|uniref:Alpha-galactosidase, NPCBM associated NEW3 domain protein n=1 Tax=Truepera radiovictrix (strain DSM 17093 / CIP 108686 / LMG 22925 / RQ-24) TaxID=649638 RepID=D7CU60_TRURR|nr:NEW3 domain-containing protein [Truepera radiovictrix]ADI13958.1 Alpha-galactosidase, NPCBM associated NEW3 domain protein [Truepera radiovictrix DSM 17093]WMT57478.1 NEW3 domain-containing protein [Truepera radiovictrix]
MNRFPSSLLPVLCGFLILGGASAQPQDAEAPQTDYRGLALTTPFPATSVSLEETTTLELTVRNYGLPPQLLDLTVSEAPEGWTVTFLGNGVPVKQVQVGPDESVELSLQVEPPAEAEPGDYTLTLRAEGEGVSDELPLTLTLAQLLPPRLSLTSELPALRGGPTTSFTFNVRLQNESSTDATATLQAQTPPGFSVAFRSGGNEVTSIPVAAGETQSLSVEVSPPPNVTAGDYEVLVQATSERAQAELPLGLEITGRPELNLTSVDGVLSARAAIGQSTPLQLVVLNTGSAPAEDVSFSATTPDGWTATFEPETLPRLEPGQQEQVRLNLTPAENAIAGDYVLTLRASGEGLSESADFRITTTTSTLWGGVAVAVIAVALLVMGGAVARFGRR